MKTIRKIMLLGTVLGMLAACGDGDAPVVKDREMPTITGEGIVASPLNCDVYHPGDVIPFRYIFKDNMELGNYNIDIHNNFDHHTHSTESEECPLEPEIPKTTAEGKAKYDNAWHFNKTYAIPEGSKEYVAHDDIQIPKGKTTGDYHFLVTFTDKAGNQQHKSFSIKIKN